MADNNSIDLRRKNSDLTDAIAEADRARQEGLTASRRASSANRKARDLEEENDKLRKLVEEQNIALVDKNRLIVEWMHGSQSFKTLAKKYAKDLALSQEIFTSDLDEIIVETARENPLFSDTKVLKSVREKSR